MRLDDLVRRIEKQTALDQVAERLAGLVSRAVPHGLPKDLLSGSWLGHPLHPLLTDVPIGAWTCAMALDVLGGESAAGAADGLVAVGLVTAVPTAAAGLSDWADTVEGERRVGLVHAAGNVGALLLYSASLAARRSGSRGTGRVLGALGLASVMAGGYLGGHLAYALGVGVDHTVFEHGPDEWTPAIEESRLAEGAPTAATVDGTTLLLYRRHGVVHALADTCTHAGGPLHEGTVDESLCVTCPWHGSVFRLEDGAVVHGPATAPQKAYDTRVVDGRVEVRRRS